MPLVLAVLGVAAIAADTRERAPDVDLIAYQTVERIGAGQGLSEWNGFIYPFGDADTGIIRECRLVREPAPRLEPTGRDILLTVDGADIVPHPTGLAFHPEHGTFLGNTVGGKGTIRHIDWARALEQGTLDGAVLNTTTDDLAVNGCRPEYVRIGDRWLIATSDYGDEGNEVRLYDPQRLARASSTSEPGVLVARFPCGPWVQSLHWIDESETLVLVQNQIVGLRYRLTPARFEGLARMIEHEPIDLDEPTDELEGFCLLGDNLGILLSASRERNVWFALVDLED